MPKGPKGQNRPSDTVSNAIKVAKIATGKETEDMPPDEQRPGGGQPRQARRQSASGEDHG